MAYLLNVVYLLLLIALSPWLVYQAAVRGKYRQGYAEKLLGRVPRRQGREFCVWLHAVSVGEVNLLQPLIAELEQRRPAWRLVLTTTTATGHALAKKKYPHLSVCYCPLDFSWATAAAVNRIRPDLLILAELELWPNLLRSARRGGAEIAVVNGRLSEHSRRGYKRLGPVIGWMLRQVALIAVQNENYAAGFRELGARPETVLVTGSLKFDGARVDRSSADTLRLRELAQIAEEDVVFLAGSTQEPEERLALETYLALKDEHPRLKLLIVPRHPERFEQVARMLNSSGVSWQRRSALEAESGETPPHHVLLVDTIGELGAWWGAAHIAFVGGSLGSRGGQNMIEPAAYGAAVSFGPNTRNFRDIVALLLEGQAAEVVADGESLTAFVQRCLEQPEHSEELGRRATQLVRTQLGATGRTCDALLELTRSADAPVSTAARSPLTSTSRSGAPS